MLAFRMVSTEQFLVLFRPVAVVKAGFVLVPEGREGIAKRGSVANKGEGDGNGFTRIARIVYQKLLLMALAGQPVS
jgi:hypothetical protein